MLRQNSFDFVRFCAAVGVLIGHQFIITGTGPPWGISNQSVAEIPLAVFFALSGFLIYQSLERSNDFASFLAARLVRIGPTLLGAVVLASACTLIYFNNYAHLIDHLKYVYRNVFFVFRMLSDYIPGVFEGNPTPRINAPLWTLAYEAWLYFLLYLVFLFPSRMRVLMIVLLLAVFNFCWLAFGVNEAPIPFTPLFPMRLGRLGCFFFSGALVAAYWHLARDRASLTGCAGLAALCIGEALMPNTAITALALASAVIGLGSSPVLSSFSKGGDASYGIYVFAWPIQQIYQTIFPGFWAGLAFSLLTTIALGYMTWNLYEKRCLARKEQLAKTMRFGRSLRQSRVPSG